MKYNNNFYNFFYKYINKTNNLKVFVLYLGFFHPIFGADTCFKTYQGQGNFHIALKNVEGRSIAIVFDTGIGSQQLHKKLQTGADEEETFLIPIADPTRNKGKNTRSLDNNGSRLALSPFAKSQMNKPFVGGSAQKHTERTPVDQNISSFLARHDVDYVMCFISHADKDHWNKINLLPDDKPTFVFINGWINDAHFYQDMMRRNNIVVIDTSNFKPIINQGLGSIFTDHILQKGCHFMSRYSPTECETIKKDLPYWVKGLNDIHFWVLNPKAEDKNGHSYVVSCRFPNREAGIGTSVLCTGDATVETFKTLGKESMAAELAKEQTFQTFLMIPHHGSQHNICAEFLNFLRRVAVNAFIVPSGNGAQYGHPSKETIKMLQSFYADRLNFPPIDDFWRRYQCFESKGVGSYVFERSDKSRHKGFSTELYLTQFGSVPIFGTNLMGSISLKNDGSWVAQKRITLLIEDHQLEADLSKRSAEYSAIPDCFIIMGVYQQFTAYKKAEGHYVLILEVPDDNGTPLYLEYALSEKTNVDSSASFSTKLNPRYEDATHCGRKLLFDENEGE